MATILRQSTQVVVRIGPFVDVGDGFTPETGITLGAADEAEVLKAAGAATVSIAAATWAAITGADGWYDLTLTTSHTDTIGELVVVVQDDSVCLPVFTRFQVVEESTYDFLYTSGASPDADVAAILTDTGTTLDNHLTDIKGTGFVKDTHSLIDIETYVDLIDDGTSGLAKIATDAAAILVDTADIQPKLGTVSNLGGGATLGANNSDMAGATFATATDSQEAIRNRGDAAWITGAGTGLTPLASGTAQAGTASTIQLASGESFADDELNGNVVKVTSGTGAGQARVITDYAGATDTATVIPNWTTNPSSDSVYEVVEGSMNLAGVSLTPQTAGDLAALVTTVDTVVDGIQTDLDNGTDGLGAIKTDTAAILIDTAEIGAAGAGLTEAGATGDHLTAIPWNASWDAEVQSEAADALTAYDPPTRAELTSDISGLDTKIDAVDDFVDTEVAAILAAVDTEVAAIKAKTDNLPGTYQKNTAFTNFPFMMVDSTDGRTAKTGLSITATRSIDGAAFGACANAAAELSNGIYTIDLAAADLNGDVIVLRFTGTDADDAFFTIRTEP